MLSQLREHGARVVNEERGGIGVALLVAVARAQHQPPLGARRAHVEQVPLALEPVLAQRQHQPAGTRQLAPVGVRQEGIRRAAFGELVLLQPAHEHGVEPARAHIQRRGHLHAVGLRLFANAHRQLRQRVVNVVGVQRHVGVGLDHGAHLGEGGGAGAERARVVQLGALHPRRRAPVGRAEQALQPERQAPEQRRRVGRAAQLVDRLQRPPARALLPQRAGAVGGALAAATDIGLEPVGQPGLAQQAGGAQVREQVVGAAVQRRAAKKRQQPSPDAGVGERHGAVHRVRDPVGAENLLDQRRVPGRVAEDNRHVPGRGAAPQQRDDLGAAQLQLGALAAGRVQRDRLAGVRLLRAGGLEQRALQRVQRLARALVVVIADRVQPQLLHGDLLQPLAQRGRGLERLAARLERERDHDVGFGVRRQLLDRAELQLGEVVEPVDEHRRARPCRRVRAQRGQRAPGEQVVVHQAGSLEAVAVAAVELADLLRVRRPRAVAGPAAQRLDQPRWLHHRPLELGEEPQRGAREAGPRCRVGQHREARAADGILGNELLLELGRHARVVARAARDQPRQVREAHYPGAERGAGLGKLAAAVVDVLEPRHDQHRFLVEAVAQRAQHGAGLGGVGGTGDQGQGHEPVSCRTWSGRDAGRHSAVASDARGNRPVATAAATASA